MKLLPEAEAGKIKLQIQQNLITLSRIYQVSSDYILGLGKEPGSIGKSTK